MLPSPLLKHCFRQKIFLNRKSLRLNFPVKLDDSHKNRATQLNMNANIIPLSSFTAKRDASLLARRFVFLCFCLLPNSILHHFIIDMTLIYREENFNLRMT